MRLFPAAVFASLLLCTCSASSAGRVQRSKAKKTAVSKDRSRRYETADSVFTKNADRIDRLTEEDYREVAEELGVEAAAMKAVVEIEAGSGNSGFFKPGKPIVNFDFSMFTRFARNNGVNLSKYRKTHPLVFNSADARKYGSPQGAHQARLQVARSIDEKTAVEGTFWGMFQIGGFNWKKCGAKSLTEFVEKMSKSEREQLELFAQFLRNTGLVTPLKNKDWATFARGYNGPSYASRGYHTRLAKAYARFKNKR